MIVTKAIEMQPFTSIYDLKNELHKDGYKYTVKDISTAIKGAGFCKMQLEPCNKRRYWVRKQDKIRYIKLSSKEKVKDYLYLYMTENGGIYTANECYDIIKSRLSPGMHRTLTPAKIPYLLKHDGRFTVKKVHGRNIYTLMDI